MSNKRLSKVWLDRHLPTDLWIEILCMLPVKYLLKFRSVSKSWRSLIDDPDFAQLHLKNFKNNRDETHLFVVQGREQDCIVRSSDTFKTKLATLLTIGQKYRAGSWYFVCSIDGLVLLKSSSRFPGFRDLKLWNPSIRKFHEFPPLPEIETPPDGYLLDNDIGLGYDSVAKDYKHVKLIFLNGDILHLVAIYTLGSASWKMIPFQGKGCSSWHWETESLDMKVVHLQGSLYFIAYDVDHRILDLVSFDLSNEVFSCVSLPKHSFASRKSYKWFEIALTEGGCTLAVCDFDSCLWVLERPSGEGEPMCWTKRYRFELDGIDMLYIKKNNDIVMQWCGKDVPYRLVKGKDVKGQRGWLMSYNLENEEEKILLQNKQGVLDIHNVCGYVESLILVK